MQEIVEHTRVHPDCKVPKLSQHSTVLYNISFTFICSPTKEQKRQQKTEKRQQTILYPSCSQVHHRGVINPSKASLYNRNKAQKLGRRWEPKLETQSKQYLFGTVL